jgi:hypothetical protein
VIVRDPRPIALFVNGSVCCAAASILLACGGGSELVSTGSPDAADVASEAGILVLHEGDATPGDADSADAHDAVDVAVDVADAGDGAIEAAIDAPNETGTVCVAPEIACGGQCVDGTQPAHCGSCSNV